MSMRYTESMSMDFRRIISRELERRGWSGYKLGQVSGVPIRTCQAYMSGQCDLAASRVATMAEALDLELRPKQRRRKK